jgi:outer membrane protein TolC
VDATLPLPDNVPVMIMTLSDDELLAGIREHNPAIKEREMLLAAGQSRIDLAERGYYPDFTFGLETIFQDRARQGDPVGNGENPVIASMSVNVPLWQKPRDAAVREAKAQKSAARLSMIDVERRLSADMELALYNYRDAGRKIDLYRDTLIPKAEQALGVVLEAFQTGNGNSLDLIDAENTLLELELAYVRALTDQGRRFSEMERIFGKEIPCEIHGVAVEPGVPAPAESELETTLP